MLVCVAEPVREARRRIFRPEPSDFRGQLHQPPPACSCFRPLTSPAEPPSPATRARTAETCNPRCRTSGTPASASVASLLTRPSLFYPPARQTSWQPMASTTQQAADVRALRAQVAQDVGVVAARLGKGPD